MIFGENVSQQHASEVRSKLMSILYNHNSYTPMDNYRELLELYLYYIDKTSLSTFCDTDVQDLKKRFFLNNPIVYSMFFFFSLIWFVLKTCSTKFYTELVWKTIFWNQNVIFRNVIFFDKLNENKQTNEIFIMILTTDFFCKKIFLIVNIKC